MRGLVALVVSLFLAAEVLATQDPTYFLPADRVTVRAMRAVPPTEPAPGVHLQTVIGATGSMSLCTFDPGKASPLHHHTREQVDVGVTGTAEMTLGAHVETLGPGTGVIVPQDVEHLIANHGAAPITLVEFHPVRRPDLVPPLPVIAFPQSAQPVTVPDGRALVTKLDAPEATPTSEPLTIRGETCTLSWRQLHQGQAPAAIAASSVEVFVFVARGAVDLTGVPAPDRVSAGSLILVPAQHSVRVAAASEAAVAVFVPTRQGH